ncbi:IGSF6 protein, partial [Brachypteracias leptosomus]|nr:IGSF6 protein [Brachypteracias leptosomus]
LFSTGAADTCQVTVTQPRFQEANYSMPTVLLTCAFSASGCSLFQHQVLWFRFSTDKHEDLCTPGCRDNQKYKVYSSSEKNISLQISDLTVDDNAVYICGIAFSNSNSSRSKQTGDGTVLKITAEKQHSNGEAIFMIIASSLLFLYSTTVFTFLVVCKKISSGRKIFQAIAQELQKQRYAEHWQQP